MYLRFITRFPDSYGREETGVFQAAAYLLHSDIMHDYDKQYLDELWKWFKCNLRVPTRFKRSRRRNARNISLSWFKSTSTEHLQMMYEMIWMLERYGMVVERVKRHNPGYIMYEDEFQVSSIPHGKDKSLVL